MATMSKENQEHYNFLRRHHIGVEKAKKMAREMTAMDERGKRTEGKKAGRRA